MFTTVIGIEKNIHQCFPYHYIHFWTFIFLYICPKQNLQSSVALNLSPHGIVNDAVWTCFVVYNVTTTAGSPWGKTLCLSPRAYTWSWLRKLDWSPRANERTFRCSYYWNSLDVFQKLSPSELRIWTELPSSRGLQLRRRIALLLTSSVPCMEPTGLNPIEGVLYGDDTVHKWHPTLTFFSQQPLCWQSKARFHTHTHTLRELSSPVRFFRGTPCLRCHVCDSGWEEVVVGDGLGAADRQVCLGPHWGLLCWCGCFSGARRVWRRAGGNVGQNSSLTSISCRWGAQGSQGGAEGRSPCWYNTLTKHVCLDGWD